MPVLFNFTVFKSNVAPFLMVAFVEAVPLTPTVNESVNTPLTMTATSKLPVNAALLVAKALAITESSNASFAVVPVLVEMLTAKPSVAFVNVTVP